MAARGGWWGSEGVVLKKMVGGRRDYERLAEGGTTNGRLKPRLGTWGGNFVDSVWRERYYEGRRA